MREPMIPPKATRGASGDAMGRRASQTARLVVEFAGALLILFGVGCGLQACGGGDDLTFPGDVTARLTLTALVPTNTPTP